MDNIKQLQTKLKTDMAMRGMSEHTKRSYRLHVEKFLQFRSRPIEEIDESKACEFLIYMIRENKVKTVTVAISLLFMQFFLCFILGYLIL